MKKSYIQINGKLVPKDSVTARADGAPAVMGDIEPFKSPITGEVIRGRGHLRQHMKDHGVTHASDYSDDWYKKRREGIDREQRREGRAERISIMKRKMGML